MGNLRGKSCSVDGCQRAQHCKGLCKKHYERLRIRGTLDRYTSPTPLESFQQKCRVTDSGCWEWTGEISHNGYGRHVVEWLPDKRSRRKQAHVFAYTAFVGEIPAGYQVDHLCHDPAICQPTDPTTCQHRRCVNPAHLAAVTAWENNARSRSPNAINAAKTHCLNGHPLSGANLYVRGDRPTRRECRACRRARSRTSRPKRESAA